MNKQKVGIQKVENVKVEIGADPWDGEKLGAILLVKGQGFTMKYHKIGKVVNLKLSALGNFYLN